jgi:hypothetical protein
MKLKKFIDQLTQLEEKYGERIDVYVLMNDEGDMADCEVMVGNDGKKDFIAVAWKQ